MIIFAIVIILIIFVIVIVVIAIGVIVIVVMIRRKLSTIVGWPNEWPGGDGHLSLSGASEATAQA